MNTKKNTVKKSSAAPSVRPKSVGAATAASILGGGTSTAYSPNGQVKIKPDWAKYYKHLLELRERLLDQMSGLAKESAEEISGYSLHMADSGTKTISTAISR